MLPMMREMGKLVMNDRLLHRVSTGRTEEKTHQLVLPAKFRAVLLKSMHDDLGHWRESRDVDLM